MRKILFLTICTLVSLSFGSFLYLKELSVEFPEELYKTIGTRSFLVKYFTLFEDETQKGIVFSGWIFSPNTQTTSTLDIKLENEKEVHVFSIKTTRKGFYLIIPPHLLIFPKNLKVFIDGYEIGG
ncbi:MULTISPECIES: hypothetical protein [Thermotoga]|uniref:hypothetical protein n=1 Tax=Thermotoga TaxID=2335 RepID=UPI0002DA7636|nr:MULTISPECIES: hypothetical protein [Thermotoga]AJG41261.1 hypothetical protein TRQ7_07330 [Thermotoga sp. RQ7]KFZ21612.1 hypothetical protein LA10_06159 [Thermotoga neapolitana LA10]MDK2949555.1 hypothetical protein [Thermotoga sp.]HBF11412.1 hypothetical protein [Thermotoga neapolitana]